MRERQGTADQAPHGVGSEQHRAATGVLEWEEEVMRPGVDGHGVGPVVGGNAGGHPLARLDGDGERGAVARLVVAGHRRQAQLALKGRYPNPIYWAAFICLGDPRRLEQG